ncbi:MAG: hypothetical protein MJE77_27910 [Proteobacteria bacterium]|nr:hypothetical protein [Pseudomonadota bacterium]
MAEPIGELTVGRVAMVRGTVVPRDLMDCPLTGQPCVYYSYSVEQRRRSRVGGDAFWDIVERDEAILEFYIEDDTGRAIVTPLRARVDRVRHIVPVMIEFGIDRQAQQLLIEPGDRIEVTAEVTSVHDLYDEGRSYRTNAERLMLRAPDKGRLDIKLLARRNG